MRPLVPKSAEKELALPESIVQKLLPATQSPNECCFFDDSYILDVDYFAKMLSSIKAKGVRSDVIGSIIMHNASKWLPEIGSGETVAIKCPVDIEGSPESVPAIWTKKRFFVETLVGMLPNEKDSMPCNFLLRLLRIANMVGVDLAYRAELEKRISWQLNQASLEELMIPAFSHMCRTLLDVELVCRLVKMFVELDGAVRSGAAIVKVAKLVDRYLAEAAVDANLTLSEFVALVRALPSHARATDDGLYHAIDTYLKAHPNMSKQEQKTLCRLISGRKLSPEVSLHMAQNERLPVRAIIHVLYSEHAKVNCHVEWSGSFTGTRSRNTALKTPGWCHSQQEVMSQQKDIRKLQEDVMRLERQLYIMQVQMEKLLEKKKRIF